MTARLTDIETDRIEVGWARERTGPWVTRADVSVDDEDVRRVLVAFLEVRPDWDDLALMAQCIASRRSCSTDDRSVTFPSDFFGTPGSLYVADGTEQPVELGEAAGFRLLARWLTALVAGAEDEELGFTVSSTWPAFRQDVSAIEQIASRRVTEG
jgi:hypothetical protein